MPRKTLAFLAVVTVIVPFASGGPYVPPDFADKKWQPTKNPQVAVPLLPPVSAGRWNVEFANGVKEVCDVRNDGTASITEPLRTSTGKFERKDGSAVIRFQDDRAERWTAVGNRMVVEHWFPASQFPSGTPVLGIAEFECSPKPPKASDRD